MLQLGDFLDLGRPLDKIRLASAEHGTRVKDEFGRHYMRGKSQWFMTLGSENDKRRATTFTVYARSQNVVPPS
jgi:hypothetical protein